VSVLVSVALLRAEPVLHRRWTASNGCARTLMRVSHGDMLHSVPIRSLHTNCHAPSPNVRCLPKTGK
jgi:hypothetical protein